LYLGINEMTRFCRFWWSGKVLLAHGTSFALF
jgi:hypothetical protein